MTKHTTYKPSERTEEQLKLDVLKILKDVGICSVNSVQRFAMIQSPYKAKKILANLVDEGKAVEVSTSWGVSYRAKEEYK